MADRYSDNDQDSAPASTSAPAKWAPTQGWVMEELAERRTIFAKLHAEMEIDQNFDTWSATFRSEIAKQYLDGLPKGFVPKLPPLVQIGVDIGLNNVMVGDKIEVTVTLPKNDRKNDETQKADKQYLEECLTGLLYATDTYGMESPFRQFVRNALALGAGILTYSIDWDRWGEPPFGKDKKGKPRKGGNAKERDEFKKWQARRQRTIPFNLDAAHPRLVFWDPHHTVPQDYIREDRISRNRAKQQYPEMNWAEIATRVPAGDIAATCTRVQYFSETHYGCWLDGTPVLQEGSAEDGITPNTSGVMGHRMALGGFGDRDHEGNLVYRIQGLIRKSRDIVLMKVALLNVMESMRQYAGYPTLKIKAPSREIAERLAEDAELGPGAVITEGEGEEHSFLIMPPVPEVVFKLSQQVDSLLELVFGPAILRGVAQDETATGQATRVSIAQAPFRPAKYACQQALSAVLQDLCWMIKHELQEGIWVPGPSGPMFFDPDRIPDEMFLIETDMSPKTPEELAYKRAAAREDLAAGAISLEEYIQETSGGTDAREKLIRIRAEKVMEALLGGQNVLAALEQEFMAARGMANPNAVPPVGGGAEPPPPNPGMGQPTSDMMGAPGMDEQMQGMPMIEEPDPTLGSPGYQRDQAEELMGAPLGQSGPFAMAGR